MRNALLVIFVFFSSPLWASGGSREGDGTLVLVFKFLNLILFFALIGYFLYRPVRQFFAAREKALSDRLNEAERKMAESESMAGRVESKIQEFKEEEKAVTSRLKKEIARLEEETDQSIRREVDAIHDSVERIIEQHVRQSKEELRTETLSIALDLAEKHIEKHANDSDRDTFVQRMVRELNG